MPDLLPASPEEEEIQEVTEGETADKSIIKEGETVEKPIIAEGEAEEKANGKEPGAEEKASIKEGETEEKAKTKESKPKRTLSFKKWCKTHLIPGKPNKSKEYDVKKASENQSPESEVQIAAANPLDESKEAELLAPSGLAVYDGPKMPVYKDAKFYNMNHPFRGKALILNFEEFDQRRKLKFRQGSTKDKLDLKQCLEKLEFAVQTEDNLGHRDFWKVLDGVQQEDHWQNDCLLVALMTHGDVDEIKLQDGSSWPNSMIWEHFTSSKCPSLAGKPKIFIFQACRGTSTDKGFAFPESTASKRKDEPDFHSFSYVVPNDADVFVAFSCPLGQLSWRSTEDGTWLIQKICEVFERDAYKEGEDLDSLFTTVKREVALNKVSDHDDPNLNMSVQVPVVSSSLIRKVVFKPKGTVPSNGIAQATPTKLPNGIHSPDGIKAAIAQSAITPAAVAAPSTSNGESTKLNGDTPVATNGDEPDVGNEEVPDIENCAGSPQEEGEVIVMRNNEVVAVIHGEGEGFNAENGEEADNEEHSAKSDEVSKDQPSPDGEIPPLEESEEPSITNGDAPVSEEVLAEAIEDIESKAPNGDELAEENGEEVAKDDAPINEVLAVNWSLEVGTVEPKPPRNEELTSL